MQQQAFLSFYICISLDWRELHYQVDGIIGSYPTGPGSILIQVLFGGLIFSENHNVARIKRHWNALLEKLTLQKRLKVDQNQLVLPSIKPVEQIKTKRCH
jgi:hypothetical protein